MIRRRTLLKAGLALPLTSIPVSACGPARQRSDMTEFYEEGMYLSGNFAPADTEIAARGMDVTGRIPEELTGRYLRNGPNPIGEVDASSHHWFVGDGMVHGIRLDGGSAEWYRSRWVRSNRIIEALGESAGGRSLGAGPNTNVIGHAGRTWALVESGPAPVELTYELDTIGHDSGWPGYTAHPKLDPDTGELHAICYDWADLRDHVKYIVMDADANVAKSVDIPLPGMTMIHDMSLTRNYVVVYDLPVTISFMALAMGADFPFRWDEEYEPRVGLMPRDGDAKDIIWSTISPQYAFHPMNAREDETGKVVIDICRYDRMFDGDTLGPFGDSLPKLARWTVSPDGGKVAEEIVDDRPQEFPRCHPELNSKPYRFGYSLAIAGRSFPSILKHDMKTGESWSFDFGPGRHGGEPYFVPKESATAEDDGYLMTIVYDEKTRRSDLVIADAQDLKRPALATVHLPVRVPYGFHGNWIADDDAS